MMPSYLNKTNLQTMLGKSKVLSIDPATSNIDQHRLVFLATFQTFSILCWQRFLLDPSYCFAYDFFECYKVAEVAVKTKVSMPWLLQLLIFACFLAF